MPKLTYQFMIYKRLKKDFVRVLDTSTLEWEGNTYIKQ